jgi:tetratricopeptide (TPR) repeat protein
MDEYQLALNWFYHFDKSGLNEATHYLLERYQEACDSGVNSDETASMVEAAAKASKSQAVMAEAAVLVAKNRYQAGRYKLAWTGLKEAVKLYEDEEKQKKTNLLRHRLWVARWLWGWAGWKLNLNYTAYESWLRSDMEIEKLIQNSADDENFDREKWYQSVRTQMEVELACRAEEALTWLYNFPEKNLRVRKPTTRKSVDALFDVDDIESDLNIKGASKMGDDLVGLRNRMLTEIKRAEDAQSRVEAVGNGDYRVVRQIVQTIMDALLNRSDFDERAEAYLECGLALHQIGDNRQAVTLLKNAVSNYPLNSHSRAVARWMLGIVQRQPGSESGQGFDSFAKAREEMRALSERAGMANNQPLFDWYARKLGVMEQAIAIFRNRS